MSPVLFFLPSDKIFNIPPISPESETKVFSRLKKFCKVRPLRGTAQETVKSDSIILDLPDPQELVKWAEKSLVLGGKLLCYVPTINQVENLLSSLDGWSEIEINEMMHRTWQSRLEAIRPNTNILGHTGFIVSARLLNK